jgi:hypothetical protein
MEIVYGCCVGSWEKFYRWVQPRVPYGRQLIALDEQRSISEAYNTVLDEARYERTETPAVILVHDDLEMVDPDTEEKVLKALAEDDVAIVGVCGGGPSMSWWDHDPIGHQTTDSLHLEFGDRREGDVHVVEGSFFAFSPWAVEHLRFDQAYEFLGYDDVCLLAKRVYNKRVVVADIDTHHHSTVGFKSPEVQTMWYESEKIWASKWD